MPALNFRAVELQFLCPGVLPEGDGIGGIDRAVFHQKVNDCETVSAFTCESRRFGERHEVLVLPESLAIAARGREVGVRGLIGQELAARFVSESRRLIGRPGPPGPPLARVRGGVREPLGAQRFGRRDKGHPPRPVGEDGVRAGDDFLLGLGVGRWHCFVSVVVPCFGEDQSGCLVAGEELALRRSGDRGMASCRGLRRAVPSWPQASRLWSASGTLAATMRAAQATPNMPLPVPPHYRVSVDVGQRCFPQSAVALPLQG